MLPQLKTIFLSSSISPRFFSGSKLPTKKCANFPSYSENFCSEFCNSAKKISIFFRGMFVRYLRIFARNELTRSRIMNNLKKRMPKCLKSNQSNNCCSMLTVCLAEDPKHKDYDYEQSIGILKLYI